MGFFKNIKDKFFSKEDKKPEEKVAEKVLSAQDIPSPLPKELWVCELCKGTIDPGERWSKFNSKYYHKPCFKDLKRSY